MKKQCGAITREGNLCSKTRSWPSKYCWHHQDVGSPWIGILGIVLGMAIFFYQERNPKLTAECHLLEEANPCELECSVRNAGRGEARDVIVSFIRVLLKGTRVQANPIVGAELVPAEDLPDPQLHLSSAEHQKAFIIKIPHLLTLPLFSGY